MIFSQRVIYADYSFPRLLVRCAFLKFDETSYSRICMSCELNCPMQLFSIRPTSGSLWAGSETAVVMYYSQSCRFSTSFDRFLCITALLLRMRWLSFSSPMLSLLMSLVELLSKMAIVS